VSSAPLSSAMNKSLKLSSGSEEGSGKNWDEEMVEIEKVEDEELRFALQLSLAEARSQCGQ